MSNAATFTSLALALIAIVISVIGSQEVAKGLGGVTQVTNDVQQSIAQISNLATSAEHVAESSKAQNEQFSGLVGDLKGEIAALRATSEALTLTTQTIGSNIAKIPEQLDRLGTKLDEAQRPSIDSATIAASAKGGQKLHKDIIEGLIHRSSVAGKFLLYACYLADRSKKPLDLDFLATLMTSKDYLTGYFVACGVAGVYRKKQADNPNRYFISEMDEEFKGLKTEFEKDIANAKTPETKQRWTTALQGVQGAYS